MESICQRILKITFLLCFSLHNNLKASMVMEDSFDPARGFSEDYPSPSETAATLASGFLKNSKRLPDSSFYPKIDLIFILDSSSNVGPSNFDKIKQFVSDLLQEFSVNPSATQVAVVSYGPTPRLDFRLSKYVNRECPTNAIQSLRFIGERPSLQKALKLVADNVLSKSQGSRDDAKKILFLITGGQEKLKEQSQEWLGISFYVMAIGTRSLDPFLRAVASPPRRNHFFRVRGFSDLEAISNEIKGKGERRICSGGSKVYDECKRRCICRNGNLINCYRIRKDFTSMTREERIRYIKTFKIVSSQQPYKEDYDKLTKIHPDYFWKIHVLNFFFPWHRWYILKFENLLRKIDCRVTVPYWDWTRAVSGDSIFRHTHIRDIWHPGPHGLGGNGTAPIHCVEKGPFSRRKWKMSPWLSYRCLKRKFANNPQLTDSGYVNVLFKLSDRKFKCFEYAVRLYIHNDLHRAVGGTMSVKESGSAPEFWFHHGFLDKLWANWQKRGKRFKFQFYHTVKVRMPGSGVYGWPYVDLSNLPGCVKVVYKDSKNFYDRGVSKRSVETPDKSKIEIKEGQFIQRTKRNVLFSQISTQDFDIDGDYIPPEAISVEEEADEGAKLRKSCNMNIDGSFKLEQEDISSQEEF